MRKLFIILIIIGIFTLINTFFQIFYDILAHIAYNVKVVYDVFGVAIEELRSSSSNPKNVAERKPTKGEARLGFLVARAALAAKRIQSC
jgi:hypothetical protein